MQTRIKIAFQAMDGTPEIRGAIEEHVAKLEQLHGPARSCGVTVKGPGKHRAGLYEVKIRIALAQGFEADVGPPLQQDERYADLTFAVNDTFRRARRRLQDHLRRMHGQRKKAERRKPVRAAEAEPRRIAGPGIPHSDSTLAEPAMSEVAPSNTAPAETADAEPLQPAPAEPTPADSVEAEPLFAAAESAEPTPADAVEAEPPLAAAESAEPTPTDAVEAEPLLAAAETAEPTPADSVEAGPLLAAAETAEPERAAAARAAPMPAERHTTSPSRANVAAPEAVRRDLLWVVSAPAATIDPLAFMNAMGCFVRAAAALNTASTNLMNNYLTYSAGIFSSMMKMRPSPMDKGVKPRDAAKG